MLSHTLINGVTGSGKSYCEHKLIDKLLNDGKAWLFLADPKRVELLKYKSHPQVRRYASDPDDIVNLLHEAEMLMQDRYIIMERDMLTEIDRDPVYVIIDETAAVIDNKYAQKSIYNIAFLGRAARVFLVLCSQRSTRDVIPRNITVNLENIVCLRQRKPVDSRELIGIPNACELPRIGFAYISKPDYVNPVRVSTDEVWERLLQEPIHEI